jgi:delta24(24(1))-sterol reductase
MSKGVNGSAQPRQLRSRDSKSSGPSSSTAKTNGNGTSAPSSEEVTEAAKKAHAIISEAQNTDYNHSYGSVDMRDEQIVGGGKDKALQKYSPGIIISEKGREQDKMLDSHYE